MARKNNIKGKSLMLQFKDTSILVLGDIIIDAYYNSQPYKIVQEAPILAYSCAQAEKRPGGAANVSNNIKSLGGMPILCGPYSTDDPNCGAALWSRLCIYIPELNIPGFRFPVKHRAWNRQLGIFFRLDEEDSFAIDVFEKDKLDSFSDTIISYIQKTGINGVLISDYDKGFVRNFKTPLKTIIKYCNENNIFTCADPIPHNIDIYSNVDAIVPNNNEFFQLQEQYDTSSSEFKEIVRTMGRRGMEIHDQAANLIYNIKAIETECVDVTGAGDVVAAAYTLARSSGRSIEYSANFANRAAGKSVSKFGTVAVEFTPSELLELESFEKTTIH
jgi:rfaE bifunctional protein kinase chain/domain